MKSTFLFVLIPVILFTLLQTGWSQHRYWVFLKDKGNYEQLSPEAQRLEVSRLVSPRALERRSRRGTDVFNKGNMWQDLPLEENYLQQLKKRGFGIHAKSRWLNAVSGTATPENLDEIRELPFVKSVQPVKVWKFARVKYRAAPAKSFYKNLLRDSIIVDYGSSAFQTEFHNIHQLHYLGLNGAGVVVAMFDTGFRLSHPALQTVKQQLLAEYDFVQMDSVTANQPGDALSQDSHGTFTLSVLGGYAPGDVVGPAFGANFLLAKTEKVDQEINLEEDNWAMAAEWAERQGADIVSSSLGYSVFDTGQNSYTYRDIDGETTIVTRAANELGRRGVLVVNSAGNEGSNSWHYIIAPADGFYVLAVGALDATNEVTGFSSRGPTSDGRTKPDVCALGSQVVGAGVSGGYVSASGTSASCPLAAGIAAQVLQAYPDLNVFQMLDILRRSGDTSRFPNNDRGWGKIDARRAWAFAGNQSYQPPEAFRALPPRPNPIRRSSGVMFFPVELKNPGQIRIDIYNTLGQRINTLYYYGTNMQNLVPWNVRNFHGNPLASGMYLYHVSSADGENSGKLVVLQ
ncbi:MAG TPA: T9SS type A sorting domain-containing protein [Caldithrix sp.]|nr:T9SS type A sorting domain-containing protein [Caldithrix sp.]